MIMQIYVIPCNIIFFQSTSAVALCDFALCLRSPALTVVQQLLIAMEQTDAKTSSWIPGAGHLFRYVTNQPP